MKRVLAITLSVCMILCLTACGGTAPEPTDAAPEQEPSNAEPAAADPVGEEEPESESAYKLPFTDEPIEVTVFYGVNPDVLSAVSGLDGNFFLEELAKRTGVTLIPQAVAGNTQNENFMLILAGNTYPDLMCNVASLYSSGVDGAIADEIIFDHTEVFSEYAVNLNVLIAEDDSIRRDITTDSGNIGGFPIISEKPAVEGTNGPMIRQDWLDELELDIPETYDDLTNVLTAFQSEKAASAPIIVPYCAVPINNFLVGGYGVKGCSFDDYESIEPYYQENGVVKYGPVQQGFKEYLSMLNDWYTNGLLWQDFMTDLNVNNPNETKIFAGETGVFYGNYTMISFYNERIGGSANVVAMPDQTKVAGESIPVGFETSRAFRVAWSMTTACEYPELVTRTIDYLYGEEGALLCTWGVEDVTFTVDADGNRTMTDLILNNPDGLSEDAARYYYLLDGQPCLSGDSRSAGMSETELAAQGIWASNRTGEYNMPKGMYTTAEEGEVYNSHYADIKTHLAENILKFVTGARSLDEFDDFVSEIEGMGIDECIAVKQAAYERYQSR